MLERCVVVYLAEKGTEAMARCVGRVCFQVYWAMGAMLRGGGGETPRQDRYWNHSNEFIFLPKSIHTDPTGLDSSEILSDMSVTPAS